MNKARLTLWGLVYFVCLRADNTERHNDFRQNLAWVNGVADVASLFPRTKEEIAQRLSVYTESAQKAIDAIISIPDDKRTFVNTAQALDSLMALSDLAIARDVFYLTGLANPDAQLRKASQGASVRINDFLVDHVTNNIQIYRAFKTYVDGNATQNPE